MRVSLNAHAILETHAYEYGLRVLFGGIVTVITGLVAKEFGPVVGGLFLAFPAILPAGITLVEKHVRRREAGPGKHAARYARIAAARSATGASIGSLGLIAFGAVIWQLMPRLPAWLVLLLAIVSWGLVSFASWYLIRPRTKKGLGGCGPKNTPAPH